MAASSLTLRHRLRELRELGWQGSAFRVGWELKRRSGYFRWTDKRPTRDAATSCAIAEAARHWRERSWFTPGARVREALAPLLPATAVDEMIECARRASSGEILSFSHDFRDCGNPLLWHRDPVTREEVASDAHWSVALGSVRGDVKDLWEMGRFPHAYAMARAACLRPELGPTMARALSEQIIGFIAANPFARGVHWASGQEVAFRAFAWTFASSSLLVDHVDDDFLVALLEHLYDAAVHVARHVDYARNATYNNHLLSEAAFLLLTAHLMPGATSAPELKRLGRTLFDEGVRRQFYADGGYIQQANNYHRVALQDLLWAVSILRAGGEREPESWRAAGLRSLEFLYAQQSHAGHLPNYGNNDGALVSPLSACGYDDYRPTLQALSVMMRGVRLYPPGPWDEEATWFHGPLPSDVVSLPQCSRSFPASGHHVLRRASADSFAVFRCGTLLDRFTQMDMLHLDLFWRGHNVVTDPGSYRYNGAPRWSAHFVGTACHNTVVVDGADQMVPVRPFKMLYPTEAHLLSFEASAGSTACRGEHLGYRRLPGAVTHRRAVLAVHDDVWVIVDSVTGRGHHEVRLHWQLGAYPCEDAGVVQTPAGSFAVKVFSTTGERLALDVVAGAVDPPRGWISRRYSDKVAAPSVVVATTGALPTRFVTVLGPHPLDVSVDGGVWRVYVPGRAVRFSLVDDVPKLEDAEPAAAPDPVAPSPQPPGQQVQ